MISRIRNVLKKHPRRVLVVGIILITLAVFGILLAIQQKSDNGPSAPNKDGVITYSTDSPDESKTNADNYNWKGEDNDPKKIRIAKFGVDAFIQKAGVDQNKQVAVPNNVHLASWFVETQRPGQKGLSVIDGHVSGKTTDGVFKNLSKLVKDDTFEIELGNGKMLTYKVLKVDSVPTDQAASILFSQEPQVASQVNLITCTGTYVAKDRAYDKRVIVSAELE